MAADDSALVPVTPDDTIDSVLSKVRDTGARSVQLLVPDGTAALQMPRGFERLRRALEADRIGLLVISSDAQTLDAARRSQIDTIGVQGARVTIPPPSRAPDRYTTQVLPATPPADRDAAFLDALDQVPSGDRYAGVEDDDADLYAALDDLSDTFQQQDARARRPARDDDRGLGDDEDFAAELDAWSDAGDTLPAGRAARDDRDYDAAPPRRYSAADMDLTDEDMGRQRGGRRTEAQRTRAVPHGSTARRTRATGSGRFYDDEDEVAPRRRSALTGWLPLAILLLIALALVAWYLLSRTSITVAPPTSAASAHPFSGVVIPLAAAGAGVQNTAVQAEPVSALAQATVTGSVQKETLTPAGTAKGAVTIINTSGAAVPLPAGTEFIGTNDKQQEVRFTLDSDVTVPGATTTNSLTGSSTTFGQINVNVTARSPGGASNVPDNSIKQIVIQGQQPIVSDKSNFIIRHAAITGGSEQPQRVVTEEEVGAVLQETLTQLYGNGLQALRAKIDESKLGIDGTTVSPSTSELGKDYGRPDVNPPIGQTVDPASPTFTVTVQKQFSALATPNARPVSKQLETVAPQYFAQLADKPCKASERQETAVNNWSWNGERLVIDGAISCVPIGGLPPDVAARVKDAVSGKSYAEADAGLRALQQQGLIGDYQLPQRNSFPRFGWLIGVDTAQARPAQGTPSLPQTTPGEAQPTQRTP